jgi:hypothetical protein
MHRIARMCDGFLYSARHTRVLTLITVKIIETKPHETCHEGVRGAWTDPMVELRSIGVPK